MGGVADKRTSPICVAPVVQSGNEWHSLAYKMLCHSALNFKEWNGNNVNLNHLGTGGSLECVCVCVCACVCEGEWGVS